MTFVNSVPTATGAMNAADWCRSQYIISGGDKVASGLQMSWLTGRTVRVAAGTGVVGGITFTNPNALDFTSDLESSANPRIDRLVARKLWPSLQVEFAILKGAAAADPVLPALTQDHGGVWEFGLAYWTVPASMGPSIVNGEVWGHYINIHIDNYTDAAFGGGLDTGASVLLLAVPSNFRIPGEGKVEADVLVSMYAENNAAGSITVQMLGQSKSVTWRVSTYPETGSYPSTLIIPVRMVADVPPGGGTVPVIVTGAAVPGGSQVRVVHVSADLAAIMP